MFEYRIVKNIREAGCQIGYFIQYKKEKFWFGIWDHWVDSYHRTYYNTFEDASDEIDRRIKLFKENIKYSDITYPLKIVIGDEENKK